MGLGVIRALGEMGVPVAVVQYDEQDMGYASRYVRERIWAPHPEAFEGRFIDLLVELAPRFDRGLLIPASDAALAAVSRNKELLEGHYTVACTEWEITRLFIEKERTYALAEEVGVAAPKTLVPRSLEDVERYGESAPYPCLVKPSQGHLFKARFGTKMVQVGNLDHMLEVYRRASEAGLEVMLQEIVPGPDSNGANYNSYFWNGEPLVEFTAKKLRSSPPRFGSPRVALSEHVPEVIEPGRKILGAMGFYGFSCTEFKRDERDGVWKLMEVNGRHNLSSRLAVRCGINFPWLQYRHLVAGELPSPVARETGIYWIDLVRDMGCNVKHFGKEPYSLAEYLRPYLRPHVFAILDWRDPRPFIVRCARLVRAALRSVFNVPSSSRLHATEPRCSPGWRAGYRARARVDRRSARRSTRTT